MQTYFKRSLSFVLALLLWQPIIHAENLQDHPSPYLKLHANDPVKWQLWGKKVLEQAARQNKLVYVSVGYFSCHWCHVMQKESYADPMVGEFLNKHFIPVKVDRELRPDLDRRLIRFVEALNGQAGWPLNVFMTADGYPVTGFTYLPRDDFLKVLEELHKQWQQRDEEIKKIGQAYFEQTETSVSRSTLLSLPDEHFSKVVDAFVSQAMLIGDELQGGFGQTTKFPSYPQVKALLEVIQRYPNIDEEVISFLQLTLDTMASRHLMDHVNGGFFRYVIDPDWQTPHFEKMLYDNAHLALLYFQAHELWPDRGYASIGLRTVEFMLSSMLDSSGGFHASLSAVDEHNVEGGAYYWSMEDLQALLTEAELQTLESHWQLDGQPILIRPLEGGETDSFPLETGQSILTRLRQAKRPVMPIDYKKLASWNALALRALLQAEQHSQDEQMRGHTDRLYRFVVENFISKGKALRMATEQRFAETTLADYAHLAHALQSYALRRNNRQAQLHAVGLVEQAFALYYRDGRWIQDTQSLIPGQVGQWVIQDSVLQSPLSLLLETVLLMPADKTSQRKTAQKLLSYLTQDMLDLPFHYASSIMLKHRYLQKASEQPGAKNNEK